MAETDTKETKETAPKGEGLEAQLERSERESAIQRAAASESARRSELTAAENERLRQRLAKNETSQVAVTIESLESKRDKLQKDYAQALTDGEFDTAAKLQFEMAEVATKLTAWSSRKEQMGDGKEVAPPANPTEDRERFLSTLQPQTAAWLRQNDRYFTDPGFKDQVTRAHHGALAAGHRQDSPEYLTFIEGKVSPKDDDADASDDRRERREPPPIKQPGKRQLVPSVPPAREATTPRKLKQGDTYIPPAMLDAAKWIDVAPEDYHAEYKRLVEAGEIADRFNLFK